MFEETHEGSMRLIAAKGLSLARRKSRAEQRTGLAVQRNAST